MDKNIFNSYYHITKKYLGIKPILQPKVPEDPRGKITQIEGNIPRICVSSEIFTCIRAMIGQQNFNGVDVLRKFGKMTDNTSFHDQIIDCEVTNPCIYFTDQTPYIPPNVSDFRWNDERWFIHPTQFYFAGLLSLKDFLQFHVKKTDIQNEIVHFENNQFLVTLADYDFIYFSNIDEFDEIQFPEGLDVTYICEYKKEKNNDNID